MDAGDAKTWANTARVHIRKTYSFFDLGRREIGYRFHIPALDARPYQERDRSVIVHGGGWALGNFMEKTRVLENKSYQQKIIIRDWADYDPARKNVSFYLNDPSWDPLTNADPGNLFPRLGAISEPMVIQYLPASNYHPALDLMNAGRAVISKPGGMTLADAIITETPFIYLEPMGSHEQGNQLLIDALKIGTSFHAWEQSDFSDRLLAEFHANISRLKKDIPDFVPCYLRDLGKE